MTTVQKQRDTTQGQMCKSGRHCFRVSLTLLLSAHVALFGCRSDEDASRGPSPDNNAASNEQQANTRPTDVPDVKRERQAIVAAQEQADAARDIKELGRQLATGLCSRDTEMVKNSFAGNEEFSQAFSTLVVLDNGKRLAFREAMSKAIAMLPNQIEDCLRIYADTEARSKLDLSAMRIDEVIVAGHKTRRHIVQLEAFDYLEIYLTHPEDAGSRYLLKSGGGARLAGKWKFLEVWQPLVRVPR